jgi:hypothetical protein
VIAINSSPYYDATVWYRGYVVFSVMEGLLSGASVPLWFRKMNRNERSPTTVSS